MKKTFLIISAVVLTTLVACKKETTTNTTSGTNSATVNYGTYSGGDFTIKTVGITYKKDGSIDQNTPKQESTMVIPKWVKSTSLNLPTTLCTSTTIVST